MTTGGSAFGMSGVVTQEELRKLAEQLGSEHRLRRHADRAKGIAIAQAREAEASVEDVKLALKSAEDALDALKVGRALWGSTVGCGPTCTDSSVPMSTLISSAALALFRAGSWRGRCRAALVETQRVQRHYRGNSPACITHPRVFGT
jgi:hypothetical protein